MPQPHRYVDDGKYLAHFADAVQVRCVRCAHRGVVTAEWTSHRWTAAFACGACGLELASGQDDWVGPVVMTGRRPCGQCGHKWLQPSQTQESWPRSVITSLEAECLQCKRTTTVPVNGVPVRSGSEAIDPHFGQPLFFVDEGRHGRLWAYNLNHLNELRRYVEASLRERSSDAGNKSMASRLPAWIKSAKNRAAVLKRIERLAAAA